MIYGDQVLRRDSLEFRQIPPFPPTISRHFFLKESVFKLEVPGAGLSLRDYEKRKGSVRDRPRRLWIRRVIGSRAKSPADRVRS